MPLPFRHLSGYDKQLGAAHWFGEDSLTRSTPSWGEAIHRYSLGVTVARREKSSLTSMTAFSAIARIRAILLRSATAGNGDKPKRFFDDLIAPRLYSRERLIVLVRERRPGATGSDSLERIGKTENVMATTRGIDPADAPRQSDSFASREVDSLRELRQLAGKGQADIASALNIKQPSVSKIEKQTDMHISTLRHYVEALGGELELMVKLPKRPALRIHQLGEVLPSAAENVPVQGKGDASSPRRRHG